MQIIKVIRKKIGSNTEFEDYLEVGHPTCWIDNNDQPIMDHPLVSIRMGDGSCEITSVERFVKTNKRTWIKKTDSEFSVTKSIVRPKDHELLLQPADKIRIRKLALEHILKDVDPNIEIPERMDRWVNDWVDIFTLGYKAAIEKEL